MGAVAVGFGVLVAVFTVVAVGGGVVKCTFADNPEKKDVPEKFMHHTLETGGKMAVEMGKWARDKANDPKVQEVIKDLTEETLETTEQLAISVLKGSKKYMDESTAKRRQEQEPGAAP